MSGHRTIGVSRKIRDTWLTVGQKVEVADGKKGEIKSIDKRFKRPYGVSVEMPSGSNVVRYYGAWELRITR